MKNITIKGHSNHYNIKFFKGYGLCLSLLQNYLKANSKLIKNHYTTMTVLQDLESQSYISLETYKKNTQPVRTPVWFVIDSGLVYVITREHTGKVKRIKNNPSVKLATCTFGGKPTGEWISGDAKRVDGEESKNAIKLRKKKYGFRATIAGFASRGKGDLVVFSIKLDSQ